VPETLNKREFFALARASNRILHRVHRCQ